MIDSSDNTMHDDIIELSQTNCQEISLNFELKDNKTSFIKVFSTLYYRILSSL